MQLTTGGDNHGRGLKEGHPRMANLMKKISNEQIFTEILESGFITKSQIQLLKNRSNKEGYDLFDYSIFDKLDEIKITPEQGEQGLT